MAQGTGLRDSFITKKMHELSNIYKMYETTSGDTKEMWKKKWYDLVKVIAARIRQLKQD